MTLDEISDILGEEGWEFEEEVPGKNGDNDMLVYTCNSLFLMLVKASARGSIRLIVITSNYIF